MGWRGSTDENAQGRTRGGSRWLLIVGLAAVAGVLVGAWLLLGRGPADDLAGSGPSPAASGSPGARPSGSPAATPTRSASASASPTQSRAPATSAAAVRVSARDPFAPIVSPSPTAASPTARATRSPEPPASASATPADGGTIALLSISPTGTSVTLKLDGRKYTVDEGETFAKSYRVYDIFNSNCAGFLYGDQSAVVCTGDSVVVG